MGKTEINDRLRGEKGIKIDAATVPFSSRGDRFVREGYQKGDEFPRQLEMIAKIKGVTGIALDYPSQYEDPYYLKKLLDNIGLKLGMTEIDMYSTEKWKFGSITSSDKQIRKDAISLIKRGIDAAVEAGGSDVQLWLGQDGYEYPFQSNFNDSWKRLLDSIEEVVDYRPDMKITIEYKSKEPRAKCYISTIGKALFICERIRKPNVGITLDVGHSLMAMENPAESAVIAMQSGRLFHLHLNDNYRDWDHDLIPGTVNLWDTIELFYWLEKMNFDGWYGIDIYPYREDGFLALKKTVENIFKLNAFARVLLKEDIEKLQQENKPIEIIDTLWKKILK